MRFSHFHASTILASLTLTATALDGIVVPSTVTANTPFQITFQSANTDSFRVYLAAALVGANGPACYLLNSTTLTSPLTISVPADVGPSADYYTIAIGDLTTSQGVTFSNRFNLTGANGTYSDYENHLGGATFWSPDDLPCSAVPCARQCAQAGYPDDLTDAAAEDTMRKCILACPGVTPSSTNSSNEISSSTREAAEALVTLASDVILTASEITVTSNHSTLTEAVLGSLTLTAGGAAATVSSKELSLAATGIVVDSSSTVPFSAVPTTSTSSHAGTETLTGSDGATSTSLAGAAHWNPVIGGMIAGVLGFGVMF